MSRPSKAPVRFRLTLSAELPTARIRKSVSRELDTTAVPSIFKPYVIWGIDLPALQLELIDQLKADVKRMEVQR